MKRIALLFPGQGSQYKGMGKNFFNDYQQARDTFKEAGDLSGTDISAICFDADPSELAETRNTQIAVLTTSIAMYRSYISNIGIYPVYIAGHSLGEYSALVAAGVIDFATAVKLVKSRAELMEEACQEHKGSMLAVMDADKEMIDNLCTELSGKDSSGKVSGNSLIVPANYNSPEQIVVSGHTDLIDKLGCSLDKLQIRNQKLKVNGAFHSPLMQQAADKFRAVIDKCVFNSPGFPLISNVTAGEYKEGAGIKEALVKQLVSPVRWSEIIDYLDSRCITLALEMGPGKVLKSLMKNNKNITCYAIDDPRDRQEIEKNLLTAAARAEYNKKEGITLFSKCLAVAVSSKNRNFDNTEYEKGVKIPYNRIKALHGEYSTGRDDIPFEKMQEALQLLKQILDTKKVPVQEQAERFNQILDETLVRELFKDFDIMAAGR